MTQNETAVVETRLILENAARERRTMTYTGLAERITSIDLDMTVPTYRGLIGEILDTVAKQSENANKGILPVLVVKKGTNRPSKGFFRFAADCGRETSNPDRLVLDEQARVFAAYEPR